MATAREVFTPNCQAIFRANPLLISYRDKPRCTGTLQKSTLPSETTGPFLGHSRTPQPDKHDDQRRSQFRTGNTGDTLASCSRTNQACFGFAGTTLGACLRSARLLRSLRFTPMTLQKLRQPGVGMPQGQQRSRSLALFPRTSTPNQQVVHEDCCCIFGYDSNPRSLADEPADRGAT